MDDGLRVLQRLLDPEEAHADLLRTTEWFQEWWTGVAKTEELGIGDISDFLSSVILGISSRSEEMASVLRQASQSFVDALGLNIASTDETGQCQGPGDESASPCSSQRHADTSYCSTRNPRASLVADSKSPLKPVFRPMFFYA